MFALAFYVNFLKWLLKAIASVFLIHKIVQFYQIMKTRNNREQMSRERKAHQEKVEQVESKWISSD